MKRISFLLIICFAFSAGCKTKHPAAGINTGTSLAFEDKESDVSHEADFSDQITWLLGYINPDQLKLEPHSTWYLKGYDGYKVNSDALKDLSEISSNGISVTIVLGTWCPDSRREVPRFMRVMDMWKFPAENVTFIGVDNGKLSPIGGYEELGIQRVPTFIIYKNNIEAGRIIENPVTSLEQDMVNILKGMNNSK